MCDYNPFTQALKQVTFSTFKYKMANKMDKAYIRRIVSEWVSEWVSVCVSHGAYSDGSAIFQIVPHILGDS